jgi:class 3 adenylate cyclase/CHASE2 domain-containing sensor protein
LRSAVRFLPPLSRRGRKRAVAATIAAAAVLVTSVAAHVVPFLVPFSFLVYAEQYTEDLRLALLLPSEPQHPDIVIVTLNEDTLARFAYREPVDRGFLADLLRTLEARAPRLVAIDVLFDQPTEPAKDEALRQALGAAPMPVVVSYVDDPAIVTPAQKQFLDGFVPPAARALANLGEDPFDTVRWIYPGHVTADGSFLPSFARRVAERLGVATPAVPIDIAWRGDPPEQGVGPFRIFPAQLVASLPAAWFRDKIVLIGADVSLNDRHRTPFAAVYGGAKGFLAGIVIQAHGTAQLVDGRKPYGLAWPANLAIALVLAGLGATLGTAEIAMLRRIGFASIALLALWIAGFALFHVERAMIDVVDPSVALVLALWATDSLGGLEARHQREFIRTVFSRYVSPKVVEQMVERGALPSLAGERRDMTFLFTDVADFTTLSETIGTQAIAQVLNAYLEGMCQVIQRYDAMVDKVIGDAVFAIFNGAWPQDDHAQRAVRCALDLDAFAESFRAEQNANGIPFGVTRIGIHSGQATIGNFGSATTMQYTALGDAVNTAARLEGLNKYFGTRIAVSEATQSRCVGIAFRPLGMITLKGKLTALRAYEPLGERADAGYVARYLGAYASLEQRDPAALEHFASLHDERPADACVAMHLERLRRGEVGAELVMTDK